eukprot:scaffold4350_cov66-Phaeocystis_antarctica.AAC.1
MTDSYGDGWTGAVWEAPGFGQSFSLEDGYDGSTSFVVQFQPPSPPSPPLMPPGAPPIAGGYYMIESGSCGGALILTTSECEAAATALDLSDKTAGDFTSYTYSNRPPGCVFASSHYLRVWGGGSSGSCSLDKQCICKSTPP